MLFVDMNWWRAVACSVLAAAACGARVFPAGFKFGAATAAYQIEGGWNASGGWTNPLIADWFADYARVAFELYGDRVKTWITVNEPTVVCDSGYSGYFAPGVLSGEHGTYLCSKFILLAHAKAYRIYEKEYKPKYQGEVSLSNQLFWLEPETEADVQLTELSRDMHIGRYTHPIFSAAGGWPPALESYMALKSEREGYTRSRLPPFTQDEIDLVRGSFDFFGLNHYTSATVRPLAAGEAAGAYLVDGIAELGVATGGRPGWPATASSWFLVNPKGLRDLLGYLKQQFGDVRIMITENGYSDTGAELDDAARVQYYKDYLGQILLAMQEDGVSVAGYTAWSLVDNFEWTDGYMSRFGLHAVDFSDPVRTRTPRRSARYYGAVVRSRDLDADYVFDGDSVLPL